MTLEFCEYCGKRHQHGSLAQESHKALLEKEFVRGQPLYYGHWGSTPDELITCLRCGCNYMARLRNGSQLSKDHTFVCRDCGMEHDSFGQIIGEAKVELFSKKETVGDPINGG